MEKQVLGNTGGFFRFCSYQCTCLHVMSILKMIFAVKIPETAIKNSCIFFKNKSFLEAHILDQSCAASGQLCDGFCCRAMHEHVMQHSCWETWMHSVLGMVMTAFLALQGQSYILHNLQVCIQSPTQHCWWHCGKPKIPFLMQPVLRTSFP